jgi:hypothetical protein
MKRALVFSLIVLLLGSTMLFAQKVSKGDTLIIGPISDVTGAPIGALNEAIKADKNTDGTRIHKVYKLLPNAQYILTEVIQGDFPLVIVADEPTQENRPPIIRGGLKEDGSAVKLWWQLFDNATFKNLWISGVNLDGTGPINWIAQEVNTTGKTIWFDGCIVEYPYTWWATFADWGGMNKYKLTNCYFQYVGNPTGTTWNGAICHSLHADSMIVRNCTFFDFGCFAVAPGSGNFYTEVDHCTFVNSVVHPIDSHMHVQRRYTNNLFVNCHAFSDDNDEIARHFDVEVKGLMNYAEIQWDPQALDSLYGPGGVYVKTYDPNGDGNLIPEETTWELKSNNWYYTQPIIDYWAQFPNVMPNPWMNNYNKAMFTHANDTESWTWDLKVYTWADTAGNIVGQNPKNKKGLHIVDSTIVPQTHKPFKYFVEENTMNEDPGIIDMNDCDVLLAQNCINIRTEWAGGTVSNPVKWHNVADYLAFTWPLDYDLGYTNTTLKTAGTDGKPVGSLQWWPGIEYVADVNTSVTAKLVDFELEQNYPNPFNPTTSITFTLNKKSQVELKVFNVLGSEIATIVNETKAAGKHSVSFDAKDLSSGVYFYQLKTGDQTITRKMMLMK